WPSGWTWFSEERRCAKHDRETQYGDYCQNCFCSRLHNVAPFFLDDSVRSLLRLRSQSCWSRWQDTGRSICSVSFCLMRVVRTHSPSMTLVHPFRWTTTLSHGLFLCRSSAIWSGKAGAVTWITVAESDRTLRHTPA